MRRIIDNSVQTEYHTQINNEKVPLSSCNTTSMILFLLDNKIIIPKGPMKQEEDNLTQFTLTKEAEQAVRSLTPWFINKQDGTLIIPARQIHTVLDWCVNTWIGKHVVNFMDAMPIQQIIDRLVKGEALVTSGVFTASGHIVCLVGLAYDGNTATKESVVNWIIDDPYGDWHTGYKDHHGNGIWFTNEEFYKLVSIPNKEAKRVHYLDIKV